MQVFWVAYGTHMNKDVFDNPTESLIRHILRIHRNQSHLMLMYLLVEGFTLALAMSLPELKHLLPFTTSSLCMNGQL